MMKFERIREVNEKESSLKDCIPTFWKKMQTETIEDTNTTTDSSLADCIPTFWKNMQ